MLAHLSRHRKLGAATSGKHAKTHALKLPPEKVSEWLDEPQ
jgi:hypothetical protein